MNARAGFLLHGKALSNQLGLLLGLVFGATLLSAGDKPRKAKPYQQWDEKDLQTIVSDSPWVRTTPIERTWLSVAEKDVPPDQQIGGGLRQMPNACTSANAPLASWGGHVEATPNFLAIFPRAARGHGARGRSARRASRR